ncbi:MAG: hypothetical protein M3Z37_03070 [Candidatus Eremiobacteraeota bacterium]|nr:hypothetical protein [Candidatus Eremiobacteraeota bacterium]
MSVSRTTYLEFVATGATSAASCIVIAGKEHLLADHVLKTLIDAILPDESVRALNLDTVDALEADDFGVLEEKLAALPFLSTHRMVVIRNASELRNEDRIELRDAIPPLDENAFLIIDDVGEPKPQRGKAPKDKVASADFAAAQAAALLIDCSLNEAGRERYIEQYAQSLDIQVDAGARKYLAAFDSVDEIRNALDRLALLGKRITRAAAEEYVKPPGDPKLWDLGNAVARSNAEDALLVVREIADRPGSETGPLIWLAGDAQIVWELANGTTPNAWAAATGQSPFRAMKLMEYARRRTPQSARDNVRLTMKALEDSLTGKRVPDQALDEVIIRLCSQK